MTPKPLPLDEARLSIEDGDTRIERTILGAGTRVLTQMIPATKSAGVSLWVPVGSRDEGPRTAGSTHFLEHLLFKGTNKRSALDIAVAFDSVGGESNAETAREHTAYWARVRDADLDMAIETLSDMVTDSRLDEDDFSMERGVILDELAMGEDSPTDTVHDAFQLAVHGDRPIGRPVGGTAQAIREVERATCGSTTRLTTAPRPLSWPPQVTSTTNQCASGCRPPWMDLLGMGAVRPRPGLVARLPRARLRTTTRTLPADATSPRRTSSSGARACRRRTRRARP